MYRCCCKGCSNALVVQEQEQLPVCCLYSGDKIRLDRRSFEPRRELHHRRVVNVNIVTGIQLQDLDVEHHENPKFEDRDSNSTVSNDNEGSRRTHE